MNETRKPGTPTANAAPIGRFRPNLTFYHPNAKGTGGALSMNLHPAHDDVGGCIMAKVANQTAVADRRGPNPTFARFDWENAICVKLDFTDLCKILQVFRGECESIDDGRGLYHRSPAGATRIVLRRLVTPVPGYSLELYRTRADGVSEANAHLLISPIEALGLCEAISGSMSIICFGIPMLIAHDTSAYREKVQEARHVAAS